MIIHSDNLPALHQLADDIGPKVTLAYMDPPYNTGRAHVTRDGTPAFDDRWISVAEYVARMRPRLDAVRDLLAPHGCCVVHVDWHASAYVRMMGDEIFGSGNFASEIIWRYRRWPSKTDNFQRVHDVLLRWVRNVSVPPRWNQLYEPSTSEPSPGVPLGDVWDIPIIAPCAKERTGYPTQKPEALLERLILATTNPGDLVLDPYVGSGTTVAVAARLGRDAIGIDESPEAVRAAEARLTKEGALAADLEKGCEP